MNKKQWIGIVFSAVWLIGVFLFVFQLADLHDEFHLLGFIGVFTLFGILPSSRPTLHQSAIFRDFNIFLFALCLHLMPANYANSARFLYLFLNYYGMSVALSGFGQRRPAINGNIGDTHSSQIFSCGKYRLADNYILANLSRHSLRHPFRFHFRRALSPRVGVCVPVIIENARNRKLKF